MYKIVKKRQLTENVAEYTLRAPLITKRCMPGQFVILIVDAGGERIPLTIADYDREKETITLLVQAVGYSTMSLAKKNEGDFVDSLLGPLGNATDLTEFKNILLVAGGIGSAVVLPQAKYLKQNTDSKVDVILGGRNFSLLTYEDELKAVSDNLYVMTDDGSKGEKGFVTDKIRRLVDGTDGDANDEKVFATDKEGRLADGTDGDAKGEKVFDIDKEGRLANGMGGDAKDEKVFATDKKGRLVDGTDGDAKDEKGTNKAGRLVDGGKKYDAVFAVGPMPMMRAVAKLTGEYGIKTVVSMNTIMIDGTGMCGGCRLTVGGETKYACVDGPEFDGSLVDFGEAMNRAAFYREIEKEHICRLL
jgi:NAD(P)H-flavin reductase